jgi:hypothetical protein
MRHRCAAVPSDACSIHGTAAAARLRQVGPSNTVATYSYASGNSVRKLQRKMFDVWAAVSIVRK